MNDVLDAAATAACLPWPALTQELAAVLRDPSVQAPTRMVQALPAGGTLFLMPAFDETLAITKLITYTPGNIGTGRPTIQGDVVVLDGTTGQRVRVLDGPTVTARRTAAVSLLAAQHLVPQLRGPLLIVGAGVQGQSHLEAFAACWDLQEVWICSRSQHSAQRLATLARSLGLTARVVTDANAAMARCPLVVTCTPATEVVLRVPPRDDSFVAAVGAFTPRMQEIGPALCRHFAELGTVAVDTSDATHEAGDLLQAGLNVGAFPTLEDVVRGTVAPAQGPVLFKSCGWAGWDLAAARCAVRLASGPDSAPSVAA